MLGNIRPANESVSNLVIYLKMPLNKKRLWNNLFKGKVLASELETGREYYVWYNNQWKKYPGARNYSAYRNSKPPKDVRLVRRYANKIGSYVRRAKRRKNARRR